MGRLVCIPLVLLIVSSCDIFVSGVGGEGEPCLPERQCRGGLFCGTHDMCVECSCAGKQCGDDGCGGSCGTCSAGKICASGSCVDLYVSITGSIFSMGSDTGSSDEKPVHSVTVPSFDMMKTEVTVELYLQCVNDGACTAPDTGTNCNWGVSGHDDHPVNCVDWNQAVDFCTWAGGRLPSEAEWEYAARSGGQDITYPWGNDTPTCSLANYSGCEGSTWTVCNATAGDTTQGLCDMAGNVWEWVQDWYHDTYSGAPTDGSAWESPVGTYRVLRGGSWSSSAGSLRASYRSWGTPANRYTRGFRCAR